MKFNKGDIVKVKAIVRGNSSGKIRTLGRYQINYEMTGIILGYSFIKTGKIVTTYYGEPNYLQAEQNHKVYVVEPFEQHNTWYGKKKFKTNRYLEPVRCLEQDIELLKS